MSVSISEEISRHQLFDLIPFVSTWTNLKNIFDKCVLESSDTCGAQDPYAHYLNEKCYTRCVVLLLPILGNLLVYLYDLFTDERTSMSANSPHVSGEPVYSEEQAAQLIRDRPDMFSVLPVALQNSLPFVSGCLRRYPTVFQFLPESHRDNLDYLRIALANDRSGESYLHASDRIRADRTFALEVLELRPRAMHHLGEELRGDREFIREVVGCCGAPALLFASEELKGDREFVLSLVETVDITVLASASDEVRNDPEVMKEMVRRDRRAFFYASNALRQNRAFLLELVRETRGAGPWLRSLDLSLDPTFILDVISIEPSYVRAFLPFLENASEEQHLQFINAVPEIVKYYEPYKREIPFMLAAVRRDGMLLEFADSLFRNHNVVVVRAAIEQNPQASQFTTQLMLQILGLSELQ